MYPNVYHTFAFLNIEFMYFTFYVKQAALFLSVVHRQHHQQILPFGGPVK
jgi:hypothetical protein